MNICGIICEYNPFHRGHARQIAEIRRRLGENTAIVCAMSGDFVQRGEAAIFSKYDRAAAAVAGGADLVLELPLPWSLSSAEGFARGGVGLLAETGVVTHLAFGSESCDLPELVRTAALLQQPETDARIRTALGTGISYAAARAQAITERGGTAFSAPNDILAVEYLRALQKLDTAITPLALPRFGAAHDSDENSDYPSASRLRQKLAAGEPVVPWIPAAALAALERGEGMPAPALLETAILSRLRALPEEAFAGLPDSGEGLHHRLFKAAHAEPTTDAVIEAAATKRYARARIRRMCLCAALGLRAGDNAGLPPYLRVLAADGTGCSLLRRMSDCAAVPVVIKPAEVRCLSTEIQRVFQLCASAADIFALALPERASRTGDRDWKHTPDIVK